MLYKLQIGGAKRRRFFFKVTNLNLGAAKRHQNVIWITNRVREVPSIFSWNTNLNFGAAHHHINYKSGARNGVDFFLECEF